MSTSIDLFVVMLVVGNILGCLWLIWWTSRPQPGEESEGTEKQHVWDDDLRELNNPLPRWWLNLFLISIVFAVVYLVLFPGLGSFAGKLGWSQSQQHDERLAIVEQQRQAYFSQFTDSDVWSLVNDPAAAKVGGRLFADNCAGCHGPSAQGAIGFPNLTDQAWLYGNRPEQIADTLRYGRNGVMPAFGATLKPDELQGLIALLQDWENVATKPEDAQAALQKFSISCAACHGADGSGNRMIGAPNLRDDIWLYGGGKESLRTSLMFGRNGRMPAHAELLSDIEIKLLSAYVLRISGSSPELTL